MATRVIVEKVCDRCEGVAVTEDDVTSIMITVAKVEYEVDLCQMCLSDTRVLELARKVKRPYAKKEKAAEPEADSLACGWKGCDYVAPRKQSLGTHRTKAGHRA